MTCDNLCTAAKCAELEARIEILETTVSQLQDTVNTHIYTYDIYVAHNWYPKLTTELSFSDSYLNLSVEFGEEADSSSANLSELLITDFSVNINELDTNLYELRININETEDAAEFSFASPDIDFETYQLDDTTIGWSLIYNEIQDQGEFSIIVPEVETQEATPSNLTIDASYRSSILTLFVSDGESADSASVYINGGDETNIRYGSGGIPAEPSSMQISGNYRDKELLLTVSDGQSSDTAIIDIDIDYSLIDFNIDSMACEDTIKDCCQEILRAIGNLSNQVAQTEVDILTEFDRHLNIPIADTIPTEFECVPELDEEGKVIEDSYLPINKPVEIEQVGIAGLAEYLKHALPNQFSNYEGICGIEAEGGVLAVPTWWQVRLGASVPQLACIFRSGDTRTYHSISIPHPLNTEPVTEPVLPSYRKGSWQGIITCRDNSKFIINCETKAEAERMCGIAAQYIDGAFLDLPPRIYVGERKGQGVKVGTMAPTSVMYYSTGQQNTIPNWRAKVTEQN